MASRKTTPATEPEPSDDGKCANCGACKECGAGGVKYVPYPVYPQLPAMPQRPLYPQYPYTVWYDANTNAAAGAPQITLYTWKSNTGANAAQ